MVIRAVAPLSVPSGTLARTARRAPAARLPDPFASALKERSQVRLGRCGAVVAPQTTKSGVLGGCLSFRSSFSPDDEVAGAEPQTRRVGRADVTPTALIARLRPLGRLGSRAEGGRHRRRRRVSPSDADASFGASRERGRASSSSLPRDRSRSASQASNRAETGRTPEGAWSRRSSRRRPSTETSATGRRDAERPET